MTRTTHNTEQRRAAITTAAHSHNTTDCRHLLTILGLLPDSRTVAEHGMPGYRAGCRCTVCRKANAKRCRRQRANHQQRSVA